MPSKNMVSPFSVEELLLAKCWQFKCLSPGFDHVMRQPCHAEHVNQYICLLRRDRHLGDLIYHPSPAVVDLSNNFFAACLEFHHLLVEVFDSLLGFFHV